MEFPWQYNFPPFFTIQPNEDTKKKQLEVWCDLVLAYCKQKKMFKLDLIHAQNTELFTNKTLDRKCSIELITLIIDQLVKQKRAEWIVQSGESPSKMKTFRKCYILWHTLDEWAKLIYDYVNRNGLQNSVCTFYELSESDEVRKEEFFRIDQEVLKKSILILQQAKKAEIIYLDDANSEPGVKFF